MLGLVLGVLTIVVFILDGMLASLRILEMFGGGGANSRTPRGLSSWE